MTAATIMMLTYGHQVTSAEDEFVALAEAVRENAENAPANHIVDIIPFRTIFFLNICYSIDTQTLVVKHIPSWFPGADFKRRGLFARQLSIKMRSAPFDAVKKQMVRKYYDTSSFFT